MTVIRGTFLEGGFRFKTAGWVHISRRVSSEKIKCIQTYCMVDLRILHHAVTKSITVQHNTIHYLYYGLLEQYLY